MPNASGLRNPPQIPWRVKETVGKVIVRYRIGDLLDDVVQLRSDPVARVREAAVRATERIVAAEA